MSIPVEDPSNIKSQATELGNVEPPKGWSVTRRNFIAASAIVTATLTTNANQASAHWFGGWRRPKHHGHHRGRHGHGGHHGRGGWQGSSSGGRGGENGGGESNGINCFLAGTLINTPSGLIDVAKLKDGDFVRTLDGNSKAIKRRIETTLFPLEHPETSSDYMPVLIRRGALGVETPSRDLYLSGGHCVYVDGSLIPVSALINGQTIVRVDAGAFAQLDLDAVRYIHLELADHDIVTAEGVACETLVPVGAQRCAPMLEMAGRKAILKSRFRSAVSPVIDLRNKLDRIRDTLEARAEGLQKAA